MKKSLKSLQLKKDVISNLSMNKVKGGCPPTEFCGPAPTRLCPTNGPLNSCAPGQMQCY